MRLMLQVVFEDAPPVQGFRLRDTAFGGGFQRAPALAIDPGFDPGVRIFVARDPVASVGVL